MKKKNVSVLLVLMILLVSIPKYNFAEEKGKVIFISMNRTSLENMLEIPSLKNELDKRGYVSLMNIRGDGGTDDRRSYATMGAGRRASVSLQSTINFEELTKENESIFKLNTGKEPKKINNPDINLSLNENEESAEYGATLGALGQSFLENNLELAVLGNSDIKKDDELVPIRNIGLVAMDNYGRIQDGNIDNINVTDYTMPYNLSTDYKKLTDETKKFYNEKDALFIDLGDTYRLDEYKEYLNEHTYEKTKSKIYKNISNYLNEVFNLVNENDVIYITSPFCSDEDYKDKKRISTLIKFKGDEKGILKSSTTRRNGVIANLDVGVDILNEFGIENENMVGRSLETVQKEDNIDFISYELEKMGTISTIRGSIISLFVTVVSISWIIGVMMILFRRYIPNKEKVFLVLKEFIKLGMIMPLAFLFAPIFNFNTPTGISMAIILTTLIIYLIGKFVFKDDIKEMSFFSVLTILIIVIDSIFGTYLMENNIMSYDAIIGARYYGIGNEYEGVTIGCAIFAFGTLLYYKKIPKILVCILSLLILITSAYPAMGANVGGAISESIAYLLFILLIFDVKLDLKKIIFIGFCAVLVVFSFAALDIMFGFKSHLSVFVNQIIVEGPSAIIETFTRKIQMNLKLAKTSVWVNILLAGIAIIATFIFKPSGQFKTILTNYPTIFKGFVATLVGCTVTLLVNDSGIVAAATSSIYILIPLIIISMNIIIKKGEKA